MESELFYQVDKLLDEEASKIVKVLLELYEKRQLLISLWVNLLENW